MDVKEAMKRAKRGLREELRLYIVAVSSLAVAFLCLGAALLGVANLDAAAERWGKSGRLTVYLKDGADAQDIAQLRVVLEGLAEVSAVQHVTSDVARSLFLEQADVEAEFEALPAEAFPPSLEVELKGTVSRERADAISARVLQFRAVSDVESYRGWFEKLDDLLMAGRGVAIGLAFLVGFCVIAVIGNTIRLAVARRRGEIEVMKLCGATNGFVRGPFVLEGMFQGFMAAFVAILALLTTFLVLRGHIDATLAALTGNQLVFLDFWVVLLLLIGGGLIGAVGSAVSVRRYLMV